MLFCFTIRLNFVILVFFFFFFNDTATTEIYTLSLHDALPILSDKQIGEIYAIAREAFAGGQQAFQFQARSEEHTSELQSPCNLVCRLLLEKKKLYINTAHVKTLTDDGIATRKTRRQTIKAAYT